MPASKKSSTKGTAKSPKHGKYGHYASYGEYSEAILLKPMRALFALLNAK